MFLDKKHIFYIFMFLEKSGFLYTTDTWEEIF